MSKHKDRYWVHSEPTQDESGTPAAICYGKQPARDEPKFVHDEDDPAVATVGYLCQNCYDRLRKTLTKLPDVAVWLEVNIAATTSPHGQKVTKTADDPIPLRLDVLDLIGPVAPNPVEALREWPDETTADASIAQVIGTWAQTVHEESCSDLPSTNDLTSLVAYIMGSLNWIARQAWVDDLMVDVLDVSQRAQRAAPWRSETRRNREEPCSRCGKLTLVVHVADGVERCEKNMGGCGYRRHVTEAYARVGDRRS